MGTANAVLPTEVTVGDATVSLKRAGQSTVVIAKILGRKTDMETGAQGLWLDRLVHKTGEQFYGWDAGGAISTVLSQNNAGRKA